MNRIIKVNGSNVSFDWREAELHGQYIWQEQVEHAINGLENMNKSKLEVTIQPVQVCCPWCMKELGNWVDYMNQSKRVALVVGHVRKECSAKLDAHKWARANLSENGYKEFIQ